MWNEFDIMFEVRRNRKYRTFHLPESLNPTTVSLTTSPERRIPTSLFAFATVHERCHEAPSRGA